MILDKIKNNIQFFKQHILSEFNRRFKEYSGVKTDVLVGIHNTSFLSGSSLFEVWGVLFYKHIVAFKNLVSSGSFYSNENIVERITDCILYLFYFSFIINDRNKINIDYNQAIQYINAIFDNVDKLNSSKGKEYTENDDDGLINFKRSGAIVGITPLNSCWIFIAKNISCFFSLLKRDCVADDNLREGIEDKISDCVLYFILLYCLYIEKNK